MRTDGLFTVRGVTLPAVLDQPLHIIPFGDVHYGDELHADYEWERFRTYCATHRPKAWHLGMGDYIDAHRATIRAMLHELEAKDAKTALKDLDAIAAERVGEMAAHLRQFKGRLIGLLGGNHWHRFATGEKRAGKGGDEVLAEQLGTKYLGVATALTVTLHDAKRRVSASVRVVAHHGAGGGSTTGGSLNRVSRFLEGWDADVALMGDDHKRFLVPIGDRLWAKEVNGHPLVTYRTQWVGRTGSFLRGYVPDASSYVTDKALRPLSLGWVELELTLTKDHHGQPALWIRGTQ